MKVKTDICNIDRNAKISIWMGFVDEDRRYCEARTDSVVLGDLPEDVITEVTGEHDITVHVVPASEAVVFAKNAHDMDKYMEAMGEDAVLEMLLAWSKYNNPEDGSFWGTYDFPVEV